MGQNMVKNDKKEEENQINLINNNQGEEDENENLPDNEDYEEGANSNQQYAHMSKEDAIRLTDLFFKIYRDKDIKDKIIYHRLKDMVIYGDAEFIKNHQQSLSMAILCCNSKKESKKLEPNQYQGLKLSAAISIFSFKKYKHLKMMDMYINFNYYIDLKHFENMTILYLDIDFYSSLVPRFPPNLKKLKVSFRQLFTNTTNWTLPSHLEDLELYTNRQVGLYYWKLNSALRNITVVGNFRGTVDLSPISHLHYYKIKDCRKLKIKNKPKIISKIY
ncbi:hypothetical protein CYY_009212 [Polysphondylium violaceum]|uniref:Uncharacterized protein n=1 Tax=Polysphondylium violaceum TaxID=133409 RepID=A0A8J4V0N4_9MYCE|nr:hypothetical protein CYY_009212 [Polysphondylium violaceum]